MTTELLPTLDEIKEIVDTELEALEKQIVQAKKREQVERDQKRIQEIKNNLSHS